MVNNQIIKKEVISIIGIVSGSFIFMCCNFLVVFFFKTNIIMDIHKVE
jgi:hypothetical protein